MVTKLCGGPNEYHIAAYRTGPRPDEGLPRDDAKRTYKRLQQKPTHIDLHYSSPTAFKGSTLCLGARSDFGTIVTPAFTRPTRSRAIARTSFAALKTRFFFAISPKP